MGGVIDALSTSGALQTTGGTGSCSSPSRPIRDLDDLHQTATSSGVLSQTTVVDAMGDPDLEHSVGAQSREREQVDAVGGLGIEPATVTAQARRGT